MKKMRFLLAASAAATILTLLAFANNVGAIVNWWRAFLAAGGDSSGVPAHAPGFLPWLDWSAVDYSAVTTLIPALGCCCLTRALVQLMRKRRMRGEEFPFFKGSDQLNVALGLFGTLWGIIVIGYFKLDTVSMADLMQCLHTALFSTLMAVVWVFMIDRPLIRPYFQRLLNEAGLAETDDGDLAEAVDRLIVRLGAASDAFDQRQQAFARAFEARQAEFEKAYAARQAEFVAAFKDRLSSFGETLEKQQQAFAHAFTARQAEHDAAVTRELAALAAAGQDRLARYEKEFDLRQKEYAEAFRRRLDELQASAAEARQRADEAAVRAQAAEGKLKAVTDALHA